MFKKHEKIFPRKVVALMLLTILILSLLPLFVLSFYNRPYSDDYSYGVLTAHAWRSSGSFIQVLSAALKEVKNFYLNWQGTFSASFILSLQPGIFNEKIYFITTFLLLGSLIASTLFFMYCILVIRLKTDVWTWLIISSAALYLSIQFVPSAAEGFYWFNGGVLYTFFYSLYLILISLLITAPLIKSKRKLSLCFGLIIILSVVVGGGNYMTALLALLTPLLLCIVFAANKIRNRWVTYLSLVLVVGSLFISALAPGNAIRAAALESSGMQHLSIIDAILTSFSKSYSYIIRWINFQVVGVLLLILPLMLTVIKERKYSYKYPLLIIGGAYCLFSAQFAPPALMNVGDSGRHINIFYYSFVLLATGCVFYFTGWLHYKMGKWRSKWISLSYFAKKPFYKPMGILVYALISLLLILNANLIGWTGKIAIQDISTGRAKQFAEDRDERFEIYMNSDIVDAIVEPLSAKPVLFHETDLWYSQWWVNQSIAAFYDKRSVSLQE